MRAAAAVFFTGAAEPAPSPGRGLIRRAGSATTSMVAAAFSAAAFAGVRGVAAFFTGAFFVGVLRAGVFFSGAGAASAA
ncbi:hypothetical protein ASD43_16430 [Microbacterium sp. Root553]|nr:hypothetical protein ASD43_16430 [Microbacterium sp. Root553]